MMWRVDVDVIRGDGRKLYSEHRPTLADAWEFIRELAVFGDMFAIVKERAGVDRNS